MRPPRLLVLAALLIATLLPMTAGAAVSQEPMALPQAVHVAGLPTVGPLFTQGIDNPHSCTASVLRSPGRDLILTAAHCVSGTGAGLLFAPGYDTGRTPYGVWTSIAAYVDPSWLTNQDPQHDVAILRLARINVQGRSVGVQDVVGGGNLMVGAPPAGRRVMVPAYPAGIDDQPVNCATTSYRTGDYPSLDCAGYPGGTSGAPWLIATADPAVSLVVGVIGGLHQGGCLDYTSYSSAFGLDNYRLWLRAALRLPADRLPIAGSDGC
ncbi:MAG TPA: trypsin-like peptidase domain-containing protein [Jatrophihabitans sp.]|nr:trypsin-like peptidase domain-containing protein [Jatrophihabitans sp.]